VKELTVPIILQLLGILVIIAEIILPSGGLLSVIAVGVFGYSLYLVFETLPTAVAITFLVADLIIIPVLIVFGLKILAKSPLTLRTQLGKNEGVSSQSSHLLEYLNKTGTALSHLRPAGTARIENKRVDVVSRGEFIDKNTPIMVIEVIGNQIIVAKNEDMESTGS